MKPQKLISNLVARELNTQDIVKLLPMLNLVANQNGLNLNRPREMKICNNILIKSINLN